MQPPSFSIPVLGWSRMPAHILKRRVRAMGKMAFTIPEAVKEGAGGRTAIYEAIKSGKLKARKRGRSTIILAADLSRYLENLPDFHDQEAA